MKNVKRIPILLLVAAMALGMVPVTALAADVDLTLGPTVIADPNSPTGYTVHFVYRNETATSVRFVGDILLRNWEDPTDTTVYQPSQYRPGLMRGGGGYDAEMTNVGDGYWVIDVPLAAGANQYWFYVNNNTSLWITDPANPPLYAPDGLTGTARRAFNKVYVPYDAEKQNYAPLAARVIENVRPYAPTGYSSAGGGSWGYVPFAMITSGTTTLVAPSAVGATQVYLASVNGLVVGGSLTLDTGANQETASISAVGTAAGAATTLFSAASSGDTNVKVPSITGFVVGQQILVNTGANLESRTITAVGTAGRATTLAAAAAAGATNIRVASVTGLVVGDTLTIDTGANLETATIATVGTQGAGGTGVNLTAPLTLAHANGAAVRDQSQPGTGITFSGGLSAAHAIGTSTRGSGTGVTVAAPLTIAHAQGAAAVAARQRYLGIYTPPNYDPNRKEPYKTIYMQHGGGQDSSDWLNMGDVPVIMDNLLQDRLTEPAVVVTADTSYLGSSATGYPNLRNIVIPFVESNYNVSRSPLDRAFAGLSAGAAVTSNLVNFDATKFGYYGVWSGGVGVQNTRPNVGVPYILFGGGRWDFGLPSATQVAGLTNTFNKYLVVAGAHDFNTWNQLFTTFARDYLWHPEVFIAGRVDVIRSGIAATGLSAADRQALTDKLDRAYDSAAKNKLDKALDAMSDLVGKVNDLQSKGKLTAEEAATLLPTANEIINNLRGRLNSVGLTVKGEIKTDKGKKQEDSFNFDGNFTLASASDGIDPQTEPVTLTIGDWTVTIPAGSFKSNGSFQGKIDGADLKIDFNQGKEGQYDVKLAGSHLSGLPSTNPVTITLIVGNDTTVATATVKQK